MIFFPLLAALLVFILWVVFLAGAAATSSWWLLAACVLFGMVFFLLPMAICSLAVSALLRLPAGDGEGRCEDR
ncbi:MAG: hypothetical protein KIT79_12775 [Deltaproteobacteria bacterium]|nr:hypothetical protein [Deltaproteobacteria bacterium]